MTNGRKIVIDMSFIDKKGQIVRHLKDEYYARKYSNIGKAYAFFDCDASKEDIVRSIPSIRESARTPKGLQMLLYEGVDELKLDGELAEQIQYQDDYRVMSSERRKKETENERKPLSDMKYSMTASYKGVSNEDVAGEVGDLLNVIHRKFNEDQGLFRGAVVYEKDGEYRLRE